MSHSPLPHTERHFAVRKFQLVLGAIAALLAVWLVFSADKPWTFDWAARAEWRLRDVVGFYTFWAGLLNVGLLVVLIASARWWAAGTSGSLPLLEPVPQRSPSWFWPLVGAAMVFCAVCGALRLNFGLNHDEAYTARRFVVGEYKVDDQGKVAPKPLPWRDTFFEYRKPNNHVLHSILARSVWTGWKAVAPGTEGWQMREWVLRLPAWAAGIAAVGALALLLRRVVSPRAGATAAWLMALHPWFIRYSSEARGYSLLMFLIPVVLLLWIKALETDRWRWWLLWGAAEWALVYDYPGGVYILVVLNLLGAGWLIMRLRGASSRHPLWRWLVVNVLAGMAVVQLMLPLVPPMSAYLKTEEARAALGASWFQSTASHFLVGVTWQQSRQPDAPYPELKPFAQKHPVALWTVAGALAVLGVAGVAGFAFQKFPLGLISAAVLLIPPLLVLGFALLSGQHLFEWYLLFLLPGLAASVAVGADRIGRFLPGRVSALPAVAVVVFYGVLTQHFRGWVCLHPLDTIKEAGQFVRGGKALNDPGQAARLSASFPGPLLYYDPRAIQLREPGQMLDLMRRADAESKELFIVAGHPWAAAFKTPQLWRLFHETGLFAEFTRFRGLDDTRDWIVGRYQPGALKEFDADAFLRDRPSTPNADLPAVVYPNEPVP